MIDFETIFKLLRDGTVDNPIIKETSGFAGYVRECRTYGMIVARQSGKTTFFRELQNKKSTAIFVHNRDVAYQLTKGGNPARILDAQVHQEFVKFIGAGLKFSSFCLDESAFFDSTQLGYLDYLINWCNMHRLLTDDFCVLKLTT